MFLRSYIGSINRQYTELDISLEINLNLKIYWGRNKSSPPEFLLSCTKTRSLHYMLNNPVYRLKNGVKIAEKYFFNLFYLST